MAEEDTGKEGETGAGAFQGRRRGGCRETASEETASRRGRALTATSFLQNSASICMFAESGGCDCKFLPYRSIPVRNVLPLSLSSIGWTKRLAQARRRTRTRKTRRTRRTRTEQ